MGSPPPLQCIGCLCAEKIEEEDQRQSCLAMPSRRLNAMFKSRVEGREFRRVSLESKGRPIEMVVVGLSKRLLIATRKGDV